MTHELPEDIDVLLVAPDGRRTVLMSDAGGDTSASVGLLGFRDDAATELPAPLATGTYRPTNIGGAQDLFPAPAATGPFASQLSAFSNAPANGVWSLYVADDEAVGAGSIERWILSLTTRGPRRVSVPLTTSANEGDGNVRVTVTRTTGSSGSAPATIRYRTHSVPVTPPYLAPRRGDYIPVSGTLAFAAGETTKTIDIPLVDDRALEGTDVLWLLLSDASGDARIISPRGLRTRISITDNEPSLARPAVALANPQRILRQSGIILRAKSNVDAGLAATGSIALPRRAARVIRLKRIERAASAGRAVRMRLSPARRALRDIARALRRGRRLLARVRVTAKADSGATTVRSIRIRLKR